MSEWISVDDRLPDVLDNVICLNTINTVFEACHWSDGEFVSKYAMGKYGINAKPDNRVTHWMPLPEPIEQ